MDRFALGFDLKTGTDKGLSRIFDYGQGPFSTWVNPFSRAECTVYKFPKGILVSDSTRRSRGTRTNTWTNGRDYQQSKSADVSASGPLPYGFSGSVDVNNVKKDLSNTSEWGAYSETLDLVGLYDTTIAMGEAVLQLQFVRDVQTLNDVEDQLAYRTFIERYGTHYKTWAAWGGALTMTSTIKEEYAEKETVGDLSASAELRYKIVKAGPNAGSFELDKNSDYEKHSTQTHIVTGGDPSYAALDAIEHWDDWVKTTYCAPDEIDVHVQPISELIFEKLPGKQNISFALANYIDDYLSDGPSLDHCSNQRTEWEHLRDLLNSTYSSASQTAAQKAIACVRDLVDSPSGCCIGVSGAYFDNDWWCLPNPLGWPMNPLCYHFQGPIAGVRYPCGGDSRSGMWKDAFYVDGTTFATKRKNIAETTPTGACRNNIVSADDPVDSVFFQDVQACLAGASPPPVPAPPLLPEPEPHTCIVGGDGQDAIDISALTGKVITFPADTEGYEYDVVICGAIPEERLWAMPSLTRTECLEATYDHTSVSAIKYKLDEYGVMYECSVVGSIGPCSLQNMTCGMTTEKTKTGVVVQYVSEGLPWNPLNSSRFVLNITGGPESYPGNVTKMCTGELLCTYTASWAPGLFDSPVTKCGTRSDTQLMHSRSGGATLKPVEEPASSYELCGAGTGPKCLPGLATFSKGLDLTTGDDAGKMPIFDMFHGPFETEEWPGFVPGDRLYAYPQEAVQVTNAPSAVKKDTTQAWNKTTDYENSISVGFDAGAEKGALSGSIGVKSVKKTLQDTTTYAVYSEAGLRVNLYTLTIQPTARVANDFRLAAGSLSNVDDIAAYSRFVRRYGTHYKHTAAFGGSLKVKTKIESAYAESRTIDEMKAKAELNLEVLKLGANATEAQNSSVQQFRENTVSVEELIGGDPSMKIAGWGENANVIYMAPAQIDVEVKPISELLRQWKLPTPELSLNVSEALDSYVKCYLESRGQECMAEESGVFDLSTMLRETKEGHDSNNDVLKCLSDLANSTCCAWSNTHPEFKGPQYSFGSTYRIPCNSAKDLKTVGDVAIPTGNYGTVIESGDLYGRDGWCREDSGRVSSTPAAQLFMSHVRNCLHFGKP